MVIASTVIADGDVSQTSRYSLHLVAEQTNPWLLPEKHDLAPEFKQYDNYPKQQNQAGQTGRQNQGYRFVTPEILESLKQQQRQNQMMPGGSQNQRYMLQQPGQMNYGYPPGGMRYLDPIYDTPAVSPWGSGLDTLYRNESFPWVPNEAIGGIPPISIPSYGKNSSTGVPNDDEKQKENNVFNPFTFIQNGNLQ